MLITNELCNMTQLTWMTITDTQVRITATTLSPRSLASISRQPVWYMDSASAVPLAMEVMLVLTSQDTGTVCSASFLRTNVKICWSEIIYMLTYQSDRETVPQQWR